jgi:IS30 family transposase
MLAGRPRYPLDLRRAFWRSIASGAGPEAAASAAGVSHGTGQRWLREAGGMAPIELRDTAGRYLSMAEREEIAVLRGRVGVREIARRLGRAPSTVSRELARNSPRGRPDRYRATSAHGHAERRARRPKPGKLASCGPLRDYVQSKLSGPHRCSPEQVSRRLRLDYPDDERMRVSHEAIYQALYVQGRGALRRELALCLRTGRAVRKPRRREDARRKRRIPPELMISERPAEVADRAVPGHWEGDLILGSAGASAVGTLVERRTRFLMLLHLPRDHTAESVRDAMTATIGRLPAHLRRSLTWDQGSEMAAHAQITIDTGLDVYFCDPRSPWQRGTNENTNGLLRQYLPKGTDLSTHSRRDLDRIAAGLNGRPRKTLNWRTPAEALNELLSAPTQTTVATTD